MPPFRAKRHHFKKIITHAAGCGNNRKKGPPCTLRFVLFLFIRLNPCTRFQFISVNLTQIERMPDTSRTQSGSAKIRIKAGVFRLGSGNIHL